MIDIKDFKEALHNNVVEFSFTKKDGSTREARGTLLENFITTTSTSTNSKKKPANIIAYWDLDKEGWRSFKEENLISYNISK